MFECPASASSASVHTSAEGHDGSNPFGRALAAMDNMVPHEPEFEGAETVTIVVSVASILGCLFIITTYVMFQPVRKYHPTTILWIALLGLLYHGNVIAETQSSGECCQTAGVSHVGIIGQDMYFFVLAFRFFYTTKYPFRSTKLLMPLSHLFVWFVSAGSAFLSSWLGKSAVNAYGFCWFVSDAKSEIGLVLSLFLPVAVGYITSFFLYFSATKRVRVGTRNTVTNLDIMRRYLLWMFAYWFTIGLVFSLRHRGIVTLGSPFERFLRSFGRVLMALKGVVSALIWSSLLHTRTAFKLWRKGNWDEYIKINDATWVLRRQTVYFATKGIQYSAQLATGNGGELFDSATRGSNSSQLLVLNPWNIRADNSEDNGPTMLSYQLQGTSTDKKAVFRDFHPSSFQEIRRLSGISNEDYAKSFRGRTKERFSEGKSGSFLYYTGDQQFILKTCSPGEQRYLLRILPQYIAHLRKYPNSYICRYVGCHELVMEHHSVTFIVLTNILTNPNMNIDEFYDLKGSWVGRFRTTSRKGSQRVCTYCGRDYVVGMSDEVCERNPIYGQGHNELSTGKDINWGGRQLRLPHDLAQQLGKQLYEDSVFLSRINSMDYSLIIGMSRYPSFTFSSEEEGVVRAMHLKPPGRRDVKVERPAIESDEIIHLNDATYADASSPSPARARVLFPTDACVVSMGIIDILTPWTFRKSLENWIRVYFKCQDSSGISCVNPTAYSERFRRNVVDVVIFGKGNRRRARAVRQPRVNSKEFINVDFANTGGTHATPIMQ
ncbi:hypothetical protein Poli38472_002079 [Pythium oligandrum]|uniref:PIPK domain-containing protein n=1 Tax=Pythium oligandrum TaxID=41045 RepID=A0A8K1CHL9_PYTOL|nr:hypothetical protein Poli38472_002079 [Pythium oligandrum]|eukprot:TMW63138.1 hypothetical protein Poli38472_002079 [Pythium oligandrum]